MAGKETSIGIKLVADLRNYQKGLSDAQGVTGKFAKNVKGNMGDVKNSFTSLAKGDITSLPSFFKSVTASAGGLSKGLMGVKAALISTGIGALLVGLGLAVAALIQYFKGTEEGQIVFIKVMNNIKAYTEPIISMFGKFGKALVELFQGKFKDAWNTAKDAIGGVGDAIKENKAQVGELNDLEEKYIQKKRDASKAEKRLLSEIADLRLKAQSADEYSAEERAKAISQAIEKQKQLSRIRIDLANDELKIEEIKASFGDNDIATNDKLAELKEKQYEISMAESNALREMVEKQRTITKEVEKQLQAQISAQAQKDLAGKFTIKPDLEVEDVSMDFLDEDLFASLDEQIEAAKNDIDGFNQKLKESQEMAEAVSGAAAGAFENFANKAVESMGLAEDGAEGFVKTLASTAIKLISMYLGEALAGAIAGASSAGAATGPAAIVTTPAFIATLVGGVLSAFAAIPKFATGGIVPGSSYAGDNVLARLNSGEMVLNKLQQGALFGQMGQKQMQAAPQSITVTVKGEIAGDVIRIIQTRAERNNNQYN